MRRQYRDCQLSLRQWEGSTEAAHHLSANEKAVLRLPIICPPMRRQYWCDGARGWRLCVPGVRRQHLRGRDDQLRGSAANRSIGSTTSCTITEKAPTRAFSWLKAATTAFTFKTLLRHYAKRALTPRSLPRRGLLCDCATSPMDRFAALVRSHTWSDGACCEVTAAGIDWSCGQCLILGDDADI